MDISFPVVTLSEGLGKLGGGDPISLFGVFGCMLYESGGDTSILECAGMCSGSLTDSGRGGSCCSSVLVEKTSNGSVSSMGANLTLVRRVQ